LLASFLSTCIDDFNPELRGLKALLVVDAFITNEHRSYEVKLSRTIQSQDSATHMESGALVIIQDDNGKESTLHENGSGIYLSDSLNFQGETGKIYTLYIKTAGGTEYESEPCIMYPVQPIDTIYYFKDQEFQNNGTEIQEGIRIFIDAKNAGKGNYFRWIYNEWWKFSVPTPKLYDYVDQFTFPPVDTVKQVCYSFNGSDEIIIKSTESSQAGRIEKEPILFIGSGLSDRLLIQYCIEVRQLSLSEKEYRFWEQMKQINESTGDIFEKQPFLVIGNIHNINNPSEAVLGYFQVSGVEQKRIYITAADIAGLNIPVYAYDCERLVVGPSNYPVPGITFDKIYKNYTDAGWYFIGPVWTPFGPPLDKLAFAKPVCADCTVRGSLEKPDFWIDIDPLPK
jgi:hypothetical protein